jgi:hypothetical protein
MKRILYGALLVLGVTACSEDVTTAPAQFVPTVTSIVITPTAAQVEVGRTTIFTAVVKDQRDSVMTGKTVIWSSNNTTVATLSGNIVTGVAKGNATIIATVDNKTASVQLFVVDPTVATVNVTATVPPIFYVGQTLQATATAKDGANNTLTSFATTWTTSNSAVATVSSTGLITAVSAGAATITATAGGKSGTLVVTTTLVPVSNVTLSTTKAAQIGRSIQVISTLKNAAGTTLSSDQRTFGWASTDTTVATITSTGVVTGISAGTTTLTCVVEGKVGILNVTVSQVGIHRIVVTPDSTDVKVGATKQFTAQAFDADSVALTTAALNGRLFVWTSSDATKAVVSATGLVTGVAVGPADITATIGAISKVGKVVIVP